MHTKDNFLVKSLLLHNNLPLTLFSLEDWVLVLINGVDTINFLQGQFTCNIFDLQKNKFTFAAHCNPNGKMLNCMYLFYFNKSIAYIERRSVLYEQIDVLKKYAVFSKVNITINHNKLLFGITGFNARIELNKIFTNLPNKEKNIIHENNITILYFDLPIERFLFVIDQSMKYFLFEKFSNKIVLKSSQQWMALDIAAGYPLIDKIMMNKFLPQATNLHILKGISFDKGCYLGQEIIARTTYLNTNKHALYWLISKSDTVVSVVNKCLELDIGVRRQRIGTVLASCILENSTIWVQAVLRNSALSINSKIYVQDNSSIQLDIQPLFYMS